MSEPVYPVVFAKDTPPYTAGESAAFVAKRAVELVGQRRATFSSSDDATAFATDVAAYQAANDRPVPIQMFEKPDGTVGSMRPPGAPNFGRDA